MGRGNCGDRGLGRSWEVVIYQPVQRDFSILLADETVSIGAAGAAERPAFDPDQRLALDTLFYLSDFQFLHLESRDVSNTDFVKLP